jgi:hypothetical protein
MIKHHYPTELFVGKLKIVKCDHCGIIISIHAPFSDLPEQNPFISEGCLTENERIIKGIIE